MAPNNADQVRIHLSALSQHSEAFCLDRNLVLTIECPDIQIGRMSHRNHNLHASSTNAWFDSAVMSRQHAMLHFDSDRVKLFIQDTGSLHGTFQNGTRLDPGVLSQLRPHDELCFGITVDRNTDTFPPCAIAVNFDFVCTDRPQTNPVVYRVPDDTDVEEVACRNRHQTNPVVYRVPDDTDVEEISDDDDDDDDEDFSICSSIGALRLKGFHKAKPAPKLVTSIDLRSEVDMTGDCHAEKAPSADDKDERVSEPLQKGPTNGEERCESGWQPSSPTVHSVDGGQRDVGRHDEPHSARRADHVANDSDEWEDCSSSGRSRLPSPRLLSALPASWETEGFPSTSDSSCSSFCLNQVPMSSSTSLHLDDVNVEPSRDAREQEPSQVKESPAFCDPASTVVSGECRDMSDALPSLDASRVSTSDSIRLPSMATYLAPSSYGQSAESAAEAMGEKTGKMEYFTARLENKRLVEMATNGQSVANRPVGQAHHEGTLMESMAEKDKVSPGGDGSVPRSLFALSAQSALPLQDPPTNSLLASGEKFLFSPPREPEAPMRPAEAPELNETSAYQFGLSKQGAHEATKDDAAMAEDDAATNKAHDQRTSLPIQELVEESRQVPESKRNYRKRKAGQMSADLANGEVALALKPSASGMRTTGGTDIDGSRAVKRLRSAAEVLGYAALGGVAVVSALIATAPSL